MAALDWSMNGVLLNDPGRGWSLQRGSTYRAPVTARRVVVNIPGRAGDIIAGLTGDVEAPTVTLEWLVQRPTVAALTTACDDLALLLSTPGATLARTITDGPASPVDAVVSLVSMSGQDGLTVAPGIASCRVTAQLSLPGAYWRGPATDVALPGGLAPVLTGSTAPIRDAVVRVSGPMSAITVRDSVSGSSITWSGALTAGQYAFIDVGRLTLSKGGDPSAWGAQGSDSAEIDYGSAGALRITPIATAGTPRTASVTTTIVGSGSVMARVRPAYL